MPAFHQVIVVGHVGRDPEQRYLPNGEAVCNFSVAVTEKFKSKDGEARESTTWYRVNAFGRLAEVCAQYLKKGSPVMVIGRMQARQWEKDGVTRESWELRADSMQLLGHKSDDGQRGDTKRYAERREQPAKDDGGLADMSDDIPF